MDSVIKKLEEIEMTAEKIVAHAEEKKGEIEKRIQEERDTFDAELASETEEKLSRIRQKADEKMNRLMEEEKARQHSVIDNLEKEYEENHEAYAQEILEHIIEV